MPEADSLTGNVVQDADRLDYMLDLVAELKEMAAGGGLARLAFLLAEAQDELQLHLSIAE